MMFLKLATTVVTIIFTLWASGCATLAESEVPIAVASPAKADDLCKDAALPVTDEQRKYCIVETVRYRSGETSGLANLARIMTGIRCFGDYCPAVHGYFIKGPDGRIIALGEFPPWRSHTPSIYIHGSLNVQNPGIVTGTIGRTDGHSAIFDRVIEKRADAYCLIYQMKPPFYGEVRDCVGNHHKPQIDVGIVDGAVHPSHAWRIACATQVEWTDENCVANKVVMVTTTLRRTKTGSLYYLVVLRRSVGAHGAGHSSGTAPDYFIFRVDSLTKEAKFLRHSQEHLYPQDLIKLGY